MNKKVLLIVCVLLAAVLAGAAVLYNTLADDVELGGLVTQPSATTQPEASVPDTDTQPADTQAAQSTEAAENPAPDVPLTDMEGNEVHLSDFVGKPIVLNFWASWCGPCKSEMPELQRFYEKYGSEIHFLLVSVDDSVDEAKGFIEDNGYTFPVYFDTTFQASYAYGANSIPLTWFIDADGNLEAYYMGAMSAAILQQGIDMIYTGE